jgi:hypothetical protein
MLHGDAGWLRSTLPWICVIVTTVINCKGIRTREAGVEIQPSAPVLGTVRPGGVGCAWNAPPTCLRNVLEPVVPASSATPPCVAVDQSIEFCSVVDAPNEKCFPPIIWRSSSSFVWCASVPQLFDKSKAAREWIQLCAEFTDVSVCYFGESPESAQRTISSD